MKKEDNINGNWLSSKDLKTIILCAGKGTRILPYSQELPKSMITIKNTPILSFIIDYWKQYTNNFIFIVGYKKEQIIDYVNKLPINSQFIEQKEQKGIADAIFHAKDFVSNNFIVILGDCIYKGKFNIPKEMKQGIGIQETQNIEKIKQSYSVIIDNGSVCKVEEKPKEVTNKNCGLGFYFFNKIVFDYIKKTKASTLRNEKEITDVIQNMIDGGETIKPIFFNGYYLNVTFPEDIIKGEQILFDKK